MYFKKTAVAIVLCITSGFAGIVITPSQLGSVFGTDGKGTLVYISKADDLIYFIDLSAASLSKKKLCDISAHGPLISPDGWAVAFWEGEGISSGSDCLTNTGTIHLARLEENTVPVELGEGFNPHWWIDPANGYTYIIYHTRGCKVNWPQPGETVRQRINPSTLEKIGTPELLLSRSFNGGLSKNGKYMCTAYNRVYVYGFDEGSEFLINDGKQGCNASISPHADTDKQDYMMHLLLAATFDGTAYLSHETFGVRNRADSVIWYIVNPPNTVEWQNPEWSTHTNYCTATAENVSDSEYDIYIVRMEDKRAFKAVEGDFMEPHLWVPGSGSGIGEGAKDGKYGELAAPAARYDVHGRCLYGGEALPSGIYIDPAAGKSLILR